MVGVATGTAVFLTALPSPSVPTIGSSKQSKFQAQFQKVLADAHFANKEYYGLKTTTKVVPFILVF